MRLDARPATLAAFFALAFLLYEAHQWTRHLVAAALCGRFGTMTLTVATPACDGGALLALAGPLLTYGVAYVGMALLLARRASTWGHALVFASFAPLRWIQTLTGRGDELLLLSSWPRLAVAALVFAIGIPPLVAAWRALPRERRARAFAWSYVAPLPLLFAILVASRLLYGETQDRVGDPTLLGVSLVALAAQLAAALVLVGALARARSAR